MGDLYPTRFSPYRPFKSTVDCNFLLIGNVESSERGLVFLTVGDLTDAPNNFTEVYAFLIKKAYAILKCVDSTTKRLVGGALRKLALTRYELNRDYLVPDMTPSLGPLILTHVEKGGTEPPKRRNNYYPPLFWRIVFLTCILYLSNKARNKLMHCLNGNTTLRWKRQGAGTPVFYPPTSVTPKTNIGSTLSVQPAAAAVVYDMANVILKSIEDPTVVDTYYIGPSNVLSLLNQCAVGGEFGLISDGVLGANYFTCDSVWGPMSQLYEAAVVHEVDNGPGNPRGAIVLGNFNLIVLEVGFSATIQPEFPQRLINVVAHINAARTANGAPRVLNPSISFISMPCPSSTDDVLWPPGESLQSVFRFFSLKLNFVNQFDRTDTLKNLFVVVDRGDPNPDLNCFLHDFAFQTVSVGNFVKSGTTGFYVTNIDFNTANGFVDRPLTRQQAWRCIKRHSLPLYAFFCNLFNENLYYPNGVTITLGGEYLSAYNFQIFYTPGIRSMLRAALTQPISANQAISAESKARISSNIASGVANTTIVDIFAMMLKYHNKKRKTIYGTLPNVVARHVNAAMRGNNDRSLHEWLNTKYNEGYNFEWFLYTSIKVFGLSALLYFAFKKANKLRLDLKSEYFGKGMNGIERYEFLTTNLKIDKWAAEHVPSRAEDFWFSIEDFCIDFAKFEEHGVDLLSKGDFEEQFAILGWRHVMETQFRQFLIEYLKSMKDALLNVNKVFLDTLMAGLEMIGVQTRTSRGLTYTLPAIAAAVLSEEVIKAMPGWLYSHFLKGPILRFLHLFSGFQFGVLEALAYSTNHIRALDYTTFLMHVKAPDFARFYGSSTLTMLIPRWFLSVTMHSALGFLPFKWRLIVHFLWNANAWRLANHNHETYGPDIKVTPLSLPKSVVPALKIFTGFVRSAVWHLTQFLRRRPDFLLYAIGVLFVYKKGKRLRKRLEEHQQDIARRTVRVDFDVRDIQTLRRLRDGKEIKSFTSRVRPHTAWEAACEASVDAACCVYEVVALGWEKLSNVLSGPKTPMSKAVLPTLEEANDEQLFLTPENLMQLVDSANEMGLDFKELGLDESLCKYAVQRHTLKYNREQSQTSVMRLTPFSSIPIESFPGFTNDEWLNDEQKLKRQELVEMVDQSVELSKTMVSASIKVYEVLIKRRLMPTDCQYTEPQLVEVLLNLKTIDPIMPFISVEELKSAACGGYTTWRTAVLERYLYFAFVKPKQKKLKYKKRTFPPFVIDCGERNDHFGFHMRKTQTTISIPAKTLNNFQIHGANDPNVKLHEYLKCGTMGRYKHHINTITNSMVECDLKSILTLKEGFVGQMGLNTIPPLDSNGYFANLLSLDCVTIGAFSSDCATKVAALLLRVGPVKPINHFLNTNAFIKSVCLNGKKLTLIDASIPDVYDVIMKMENILPRQRKKYNTVLKAIADFQTVAYHLDNTNLLLPTQKPFLPIDLFVKLEACVTAFKFRKDYELIENYGERTWKQIEESESFTMEKKLLDPKPRGIYPAGEVKLSCAEHTEQIPLDLVLSVVVQQVSDQLQLLNSHTEVQFVYGQNPIDIGSHYAERVKAYDKYNDDGLFESYLDVLNATMRSFSGTPVRDTTCGIMHLLGDDVGAVFHNQLALCTLALPSVFNMLNYTGCDASGIFSTGTTQTVASSLMLPCFDKKGRTFVLTPVPFKKLAKITAGFSKPLTEGAPEIVIAYYIANFRGILSQCFVCPIIGPIVTTALARFLHLATLTQGVTEELIKVYELEIAEKYQKFSALSGSTDLLPDLDGAFDLLVVRYGIEREDFEQLIDTYKSFFDGLELDGDGNIVSKGDFDFDVETQNGVFLKDLIAICSNIDSTGLPVASTFHNEHTLSLLANTTPRVGPWLISKCLNLTQVSANVVLEVGRSITAAIMEPGVTQPILPSEVYDFGLARTVLADVCLNVLEVCRLDPMLPNLYFMPSSNLGDQGGNEPPVHYFDPAFSFGELYMHIADYIANGVFPARQFSFPHTLQCLLKSIVNGLSSATRTQGGIAKQRRQANIMFSDRTSYGINLPRRYRQRTFYPSVHLVIGRKGLNFLHTDLINSGVIPPEYDSENIVCVLRLTPVLVEMNGSRPTGFPIYGGESCVLMPMRNWLLLAPHRGPNPVLMRGAGPSGAVVTTADPAFGCIVEYSQSIQFGGADILNFIGTLHYEGDRILNGFPTTYPFQHNFPSCFELELISETIAPCLWLDNANDLAFRVPPCYTFVTGLDEVQLNNLCDTTQRGLTQTFVAGVPGGGFNICLLLPANNERRQVHMSFFILNMFTEVNYNNHHTFSIQEVCCNTCGNYTRRAGGDVVLPCKCYEIYGVFGMLFAFAPVSTIGLNVGLFYTTYCNDSYDVAYGHSREITLDVAVETVLSGLPYSDMAMSNYCADPRFALLRMKRSDISIQSTPESCVSKEDNYKRVLLYEIGMACHSPICLYVVPDACTFEDVNEAKSPVCLRKSQNGLSVDLYMDVLLVDAFMHEFSENGFVNRRAADVAFVKVFLQKCLEWVDQNPGNQLYDGTYVSDFVDEALNEDDPYKVIHTLASWSHPGYDAFPFESWAKDVCSGGFLASEQLMVEAGLHTQRVEKLVKKGDQHSFRPKSGNLLFSLESDAAGAEAGHDVMAFDIADQAFRLCGVPEPISKLCTQFCGLSGVLKGTPGNARTPLLEFKTGEKSTSGRFVEGLPFSGYQTCSLPSGIGITTLLNSLIIGGYTCSALLFMAVAPILSTDNVHFCSPVEILKRDNKIVLASDCVKKSDPEKILLSEALFD